MKEETAYTEDNIRSLDWKEHIRMRPGMYIGSTDARGLMHCIWEIIDNSVDEALAENAIDATSTGSSMMVTLFFCPASGFGPPLVSLLESKA